MGSVKLTQLYFSIIHMLMLDMLPQLLDTLEPLSLSSHALTLMEKRLTVHKDTRMLPLPTSYLPFGEERREKLTQYTSETSSLWCRFIHYFRNLLFFKLLLGLSSFFSFSRGWAWFALTPNRHSVCFFRWYSFVKHLPPTSLRCYSHLLSLFSSIKVLHFSVFVAWHNPFFRLSIPVFSGMGVLR